MIGSGLMFFLTAMYLATALAFGLEGQWAKMAYWISATGINLSVLYMK